MGSRVPAPAPRSRAPRRRARHTRVLDQQGRPLSFLVTLVAAMMFAVHLLGPHTGHQVSPSPDAVNAERTIPSHTYGLTDERAVPIASAGSHSSDVEHFNVQTAEVDGANSDDTEALGHGDHGHPECGAILPTRNASAAAMTFPASICLWILPPVAAVPMPVPGPEPPARTPRPLHELGVLRI
jgi:hypothetical protein